MLAGKQLTKESAYKKLADFVNQDVTQNVKWDFNMAKKRFSAMVKKYKEVTKHLEDKNGRKFGLSDAEFNNKMTIELKLEKLCYRFRDLDKLFGTRQNIRPSFISDSSDPSTQSGDTNFLDSDSELDNDDFDEDEDEVDNALVEDQDSSSDFDENDINNEVINVGTVEPLSISTTSLSNKDLKKKTGPRKVTETLSKVVDNIPEPLKALSKEEVKKTSKGIGDAYA